MRYRIVNSDNYGGDYPNEWFLNIGTLGNKDHAQAICDMLNLEGGHHQPRYWKVVEFGYVLQPGFEP